MQMISLVQNLKHLTLSKDIPAKKKKKNKEREPKQKKGAGKKVNSKWKQIAKQAIQCTHGRKR